MQCASDPMKMQLNTGQKEKLVEFYFQIKVIVERHYAVRKAPDRKTIWSTVKKLQAERTDYNIKKQSSD